MRSTTPATLLKATDISRRYGGGEVPSGVSPTLARGERAVLRGANGTGKGMLIKILDVFIDPSTGTVGYEGRTVDRAAPARR